MLYGLGTWTVTCNCPQPPEYLPLMHPAHIAIDARNIRHPLSGIARSTLQLIRGIAQLASSRVVSVLCNSHAIMPQEILASPSLKFIHVAGTPTNPADQLTLPRILHTLKVDLLHSTEAFVPLLPTNARKIITIHDLIPLACPQLLWNSSKAKYRFIFKKWLQMQCEVAAAVVTPSNYSASDIQRMLGVPAGKITVIPSGCDLARGSIEPVGNILNKFALPQHYLLYAGRHDPYKNLVRLIQAFAKVIPQYPQPLALVIAGAADPRYLEAEAEVARLGLQNFVRFPGHVSDADLLGLYMHAAAFVFPSLYEGQGLPPLEAMHLGVPVIASNGTAIPQSVGDAALLFDPTNIDAMAQAMSRVLTDQPLAAELRQKGYQRAAQCTVLRQAVEVFALYDRLLG